MHLTSQSQMKEPLQACPFDVRTYVLLNPRYIDDLHDLQSRKGHRSSCIHHQTHTFVSPHVEPLDESRETSFFFRLSAEREL